MFINKILKLISIFTNEQITCATIFCPYVSTTTFYVTQQIIFPRIQLHHFFHLHPPLPPTSFTHNFFHLLHFLYHFLQLLHHFHPFPQTFIFFLPLFFFTPIPSQFSLSNFLHIINLTHHFTQLFKLMFLADWILNHHLLHLLYLPFSNIR